MRRHTRAWAAGMRAQMAARRRDPNARPIEGLAPRELERLGQMAQLDFNAHERKPR